MAINNNLLVWSKDLSKGFSAYSATTTISFPTDASVGAMVALGSNSNADGMVAIGDRPQAIAVKPGDTYTVSASLKGSQAGQIYFAFKMLDASMNEITTLGNYGTRTVVANTWYQISGTATVPSGIAYMFVTYRFLNSTTTYPSTVSVYQPKLELGSVATAYRPAGVEDPNLIRNGHFFKGTQYWTVNSTSTWGLSIADDESMMMKVLDSTSAVHAYTMTTQTLTLNQTYTLTMVIRNNGAAPINHKLFYIGDSSGGTRLYDVTATLPNDNTYHTYTWTFTMPSGGPTGAMLSATTTDWLMGETIYVQSVKLEQGTYSTEWTAAPEDVAIGIDRAVIASAQHTIFDWNDKVGLTASLASNLSLTQQYNPTNETFSPDWPTTNLVITASLYRQDSTTNIINDGHVQTIKWYRTSVVDGTSPVLIAADSNHVIGANTLTIKSNDLNNKSSMIISCEITYLDIVSGQTLLAKKDMTFNRVTNGSILTYANVYLPNGSSFTNGQAKSYNNDSVYGQQLLPSSNNASQSNTWVSPTNGTIPYWQQSSSTISQTGDIIKGQSASAGNPAWPRIWHTYTQAYPFVNGENYVISFEGRADSAHNGFGVGIMEPGGREAVMSASVNYTTSWQKFVLPFSATVGPSGYKPNLQFYCGNSGSVAPDTTSWIEIRNVKLEKGTTATRWCTHTSDYPTVDIGKNVNQWIFTEYDNANVPYPTTPTYDTIRGVRPIRQLIANDAQDVVRRNGHNYTGHLRTAVYTPTATVAPLSFTDNGEATIYLNNNKAYTGGRNFVPNSAVELTGTTAGSLVMFPFNVKGLLTPYVGQTMTMSFDAKADADGVQVIDSYLRGDNGNISTIQSTGTTISGTYARYSYTFTVPDVSGVINGSMAVRGSTTVGGGSANAGSFYVKNMKLEVGSTATPWTPAPEDGINLVSTANLHGHGSSLTSTTSHNGMPTFLNTVTNPGTGNNFGIALTNSIPYDTTSFVGESTPVTLTLSFSYNMAAYTNTNSTPMNGYVRLTNADKTQSTFTFTSMIPDMTQAANQNVWKNLVYTFTTVGAVQSIDNFYFYTDNAGAGTNMQVTAPKLQLGSVASPIWTLAPEDLTKNTTLSLNKGWNTLDVLYPANNGYESGIWGVKVGGGDNLFAGTDFKSQFTNTSASNVTSKGTNTYVNGWGGYNGGITDPQHNYHAMINNTTFGEPVYEFNESDGTRQWKGIQQDVKAVVTSAGGAGDYTVSFDVFATEAGAKIFGGFYYYQQGGTTMNFWSTQYGISITNIGTWTRVSAKVSIDPTVDLTKSISFYVYGYGFTNTPVMYMKRPKLERGYTTNTLWTYKPSENVNASLMSVALNQDASFAENYVNIIQSITAKAELTRASVVDTTNVSYQWYKQDSTVTTDQGGGVGWLKLIASSPEQGYNASTLTIPSNAVNGFAVYKCRILDMQVDSITYNTTFEGLVSVTNSILPITVQVDSAGAILLNGQGEKELTARLYQNNKEIDTLGTLYTYKWYRWLQDGTKDTTWNSNTGYKTGKVLVINDADVDIKATFSVEVS